MNELSSNIKNKNSKNNYNNIKYKTLDIICDTDTLRSLIRKNGVRVVDVRKPQDYLLEHIPTAVSLPLAQLLEKDTPQGVISILQDLGISDAMPAVIYDDTFGALASACSLEFSVCWACKHRVT